MPQLAPMPWVTLLVLVFFFKSMIFSTLWAHRAPSLSIPSLSSASPSHNLTPWQWS